MRRSSLRLSESAGNVVKFVRSLCKTALERTETIRKPVSPVTRFSRVNDNLNVTRFSRSRYSEEERLMGVLRRVVGVWVCWRGCGGLNLDEEGEVWKNR